MFVASLLVLFFVSANSANELVEVDFRVPSPNEVICEVATTNLKLLDFRIGIKSKRSKGVVDLDRADFIEEDNRIVIRAENLSLQPGDTLLYLLAFKDEEEYLAQTGKYVFDGVYRAGRRFRRRSRRYIHHSSTERPVKRTREFYNDEEDTEEFNPNHGFGGGHNPGGRYPHRGHHNPPFYPEPSDFNPFGPPHPHHPPHHGPRYPNYPKPDFPNHGEFPRKPDFGVDCNDHRHDVCHGRGRDNDGEGFDDSRYVTTKNIPDSTVSTSTLYPDIDIRSGSK